MKPQVEIYDTTLRDGSQGEGINFSVADKLRIAEKLDSFGVHYIEGGWPGSNPKDIEFFAQAKKRKFKNAKLAAFGSTRKKNTPVEQDDQVRLLIEAGTPVVTIYGKTSMLHVKEVLRCTPEENLAMIGDTVRFLKDHGKFVIYDAEHAFDGFKLDSDYALATWQAAEKAGADFVVLCDTNGGCLPNEIAAITKAALGRLNCKIGIHTHDDIGLGVANALAALETGAVHVQGTINGYGERTGNCNLTSVIPCVALKLKKTSVPVKSLAKLKELSGFVDEVANMRHNPRLPWVGAAAFAHKGGAHVNAVQKLASSYEHIDPSLVGNARNVLISDLAGRSNIVIKAQELGFKLTNDTPELKAILGRVKAMEHLGYEFEAAEGSLALIIKNALKKQTPPFSIEGYHVSIKRDNMTDNLSLAEAVDASRPVSSVTKRLMKKFPKIMDALVKDVEQGTHTILSLFDKPVCEATVKIRVGDKGSQTVAESYGPVGALDSALRMALMKFYPQLKRVTLTDYKVRILDSATGTAARTRVLIQSTDGKREWGTVGVSENIIEASLQALVDSMEFALLRK